MIVHRPPVDEYFLAIAQVVSTRATCARRRVGCVLVDVDNHVLSTGYNGPARGQPHCFDSPCAGAGLPSGSGLDACESVHGEANALLQCPDVRRVHTVYCTDSPCIHCVKLLMNTGAARIVFARTYPHKDSERLWTSQLGRTWERFEPVIDVRWPNLTSLTSLAVTSVGVVS